METLNPWIMFTARSAVRKDQRPCGHVATAGHLDCLSNGTTVFSVGERGGSVMRLKNG